MLEEMKYLYTAPDGTEQGPYSVKELQQLVEEGKIAESSSVLSSDTRNWHLLVDVLNGDHPYRMSRRRRLGKCPRCHKEVHSVTDTSYGKCPYCKFPLGTPRRVAGIRRNFLYTLANRYCCFRGRATKSEYWSMFAVGAFGTLVCVLFLFVCMLLSVEEFNMHTLKDRSFTDLFCGEEGMSIFHYIVLGIVGVFYTACFLPALGVTIRRFHDVSLSGVWAWLFFLMAAAPVVSGIMVHVDPAQWARYAGWFCNTGYISLVAVLAVVALVVIPLKDSKQGENRHGPSPKYPYQ